MLDKNVIIYNLIFFLTMEKTNKCLKVTIKRNRNNRKKKFYTIKSYFRENKYRSDY
jgi:hypothetical protein